MDYEQRPKKLQKLTHLIQDDKSDVESPKYVLQPSTSSANTTSAENDSKLVQSAVSGPADGPEGHKEESDNFEQPNGLRDPARSAQPMSKNQMKKLRKALEWEAGRDFRKARRKEKIAAAKERKRAIRRVEAQQKAGEEPKAKGQPLNPRCPANARLPVTFMVDCGFDDLMTEKERISLGSQLTRSYSDNHRAPFQAHLMVSSWGGLLKERFDTVLDRHYENWRDVKFVAEDFVGAAAMAAQKMNGKDGGRLVGAFAPHAPSAINESCEKEQKPVDSDTAAKSDTVPAMNDGALFPQPGLHTKVDPAANGTNGSSKDQRESANGEIYETRATDDKPEQKQSNLEIGEVIYLTSDSPYTLERLEPYHTYIIGGLVDKNRHKGICYKTACDKGVKTAKLPIGQFMEMQSRFVLATNHVMEIMVKWLECGDWGDAFMQVIPKRKGGKLKKDDHHEAESDVSKDDAQTRRKSE